MKTLWTPWRMTYVTTPGKRRRDCLFEAGGDAPAYAPEFILYRDPITVLLLNRFPYANGHLLLAPRRHVDTIEALEPREGQALFAMVQKSIVILRRHLQPHGFNVGINQGAVAGAGLADHLHIHIVPRWQDDHNFMTTLAEVRTVPEHIEATYQRLLPDFQALLADTMPNPNEL